jgi:hypothetical protein
MTYGTMPYGSASYGATSEWIPVCPTFPKYSGDTITIQATPKDGVAPYHVEFRKGVGTIPGNDPLGRPYTVDGATEDVTLTRTYVLTDADIASAVGGQIQFSVYIYDSCPTGALSCTEMCLINIGCLAPVCNFAVT